MRFAAPSTNDEAAELDHHRASALARRYRRFSFRLRRDLHPEPPQRSLALGQPVRRHFAALPPRRGDGLVEPRQHLALVALMLGHGAPILVLRYSPGETPVQRLKARLKALGSAKPSR